MGEGEASLESGVGVAMHTNLKPKSAPGEGAAPCKFWASDTGCMRGGTCTFSHSLKKEKACLRCGAKDHWAKDCTRPKKEKGSTKGGKSSTKSAGSEGDEEKEQKPKGKSKGKGKLKLKGKTKSKMKQGFGKAAEGQEELEENWGDEILEEQFEEEESEEEEFQAGAARFDECLAARNEMRSPGFVR